jgi:D-alanyl-D-alanine carboxypeptidase (penicillin-binding protein 5/6)
MIAKEIAGSEEAFVAMMNRKAAEMGLEDTHFDNAVGFDSANNYTTAAEMAMIMSYAMQSTDIASFLAVRSGDYGIKSYYLKDGVEASYTVTLKNSLSSRLEKYPAFKLTTSRLVATKTGYTTESFMVLTAESLQSHQKYVLVLGETNSGEITLTQKFKNTMMDIEKILNTYIK